MAKQIDLLKKAQYRKLRLQGYGKGKALEAIGYAKTTAYHRQADLKLVKVGESEIARGFRMQDLTPAKVLAEIEEAQAIANSQGDTTAMMKGSELKGRHLAMFTDKHYSEVKDITDDEKILLQGLSRRRLAILPTDMPTLDKENK